MPVDRTAALLTGMAKLGSDLMLCRIDDLDLIEGKASVERQLGFLEQLAAVIATRQSIGLSDSGSSFSSTFSSQEESFREMARKNERFLKQVFCSPNLQAVLSPECHPWSSDIKPLLLDNEALRKRTSTYLQPPWRAASKPGGQHQRQPTLGSPGRCCLARVSPAYRPGPYLPDSQLGEGWVGPGAEGEGRGGADREEAARD
ncbi:UNVERIFIED_CONTAM: hypothetical protein K2H54_050767 [Gekko kuhli]